MKKTQTRGGKAFRRFLAVFLAILLVLAAVMYLVPLVEHPDKTAVSGSADWMAELDGSLRLTDLVLPGTHDSAARYVGLPFFSRCQDLSIAEQLEAGARYLDIRLGTEDSKLKLMHGFVNCKTGPMLWDGTLYLEDVLADCYAFLEAHPTETILFAVKQEHVSREERENGDTYRADFEKLMYAYTRRNPKSWLLTDRIPTLDEARGKLVLLRRYEDDASLGTEAGIPLLWGDQGGHDDPTKNAVLEESGSLALLVQDRYCYNTPDKWTAFTAGLKAAEGTDYSLALHFLSTKGTLPYGHPYYFAHRLNARLVEARDLALSGCVVLDFLTPGLARRIYSAN